MTAAERLVLAKGPTTTPAFRGAFAFLSNFWRCDVVFEGATYPSSEHAFVAAKTLDPVVRASVAALATPGQAKRLGKLLDARPDWASVRLGVMEALLRDKFTRHSELRELLLATGFSQLVERNPWHDEFWGMCNGVGENHLGKLLMQIRAELGQ